ncbi:MAG: nodulation protein NfeD, partial [Dehalococcoidia bacterium]
MSIARAIRLTGLAALLLLGTFGAAAPLFSQGSQDQTVHVITLDGVINPPAASYVAGEVQEAERANASALVLLLDTPGGLDESTRDIVQAIDNSQVPVILFVAPQGARAASAGTYIGMASHLLAMAPGTTIGSATPVAIGGGETQELPEDMRNKIVNESVSYIRAHAEIHGRNADWAEMAVREGANLPASQAVEQNVAELMVNDLNDLLAQADGREVVMADGETRVLETADAAIVEREMGAITGFLHTIANPDIAFILLSLALLGIFLELANPGLFFPGIIGGVSLLMGFYSLGTLNAFWGGILLVALAMALIIAEVITPTYGVLGIGGVVALLVGGSLLFLDAPPGAQVSPWTLWTVSAIAGAVVVFFAWAILSTRR